MADNGTISFSNPTQSSSSSNSDHRNPHTTGTSTQHNPYATGSPAQHTPYPTRSTAQLTPYTTGSAAQPTPYTTGTSAQIPYTTGNSANLTVQTTVTSVPSRPPPSPVVAHFQPTKLPQFKKPRGRPPGSRNKPKPELSLNAASESEMKPIIIEVASGTDVVEAVLSFARRRHLNLTLLSASGTIRHVTLCHALTQEPIMSLHGPFTIMSLSGTYLHNYHFAPPSAASASNPNNPPYCFGLTISGSQGQVFGGIIGGRAIAGNGVSVTATTFKNAEFYKADAEEHNMDGNNGMNNNNNNFENGNNPNACDRGAAGNSCMAGFNIGAYPVSGW